MSKKVLHYASVLVVLFLSALFLYFYLSERINPYVAPEFRRWALVAGLGLAVLGLFNMVTARYADACGHDHGDGESCGHDHGHDHSHGAEEDHHHHEESTSGVIMALIVLTLPMMIAGKYSVDRFSTEYAIRWANITEKLHRMELSRDRERKEALAAANPDRDPHASPAAAVGGSTPVAAVSTDDASVLDATADTPPTGESTEVATADTPPATAPVGAGTGADDAAAATDADGGKDDGWGEFTLEDLKRMVPQSSEGHFLLEVPQLFYTANDTELQRVLEGLSVETTAQVMPPSSDEDMVSDPTLLAKRLRLFRMFIECCAADMRPLPVAIQFPDGIPEYEEMGWVKVVGKVRFEHHDGITTPVIDVETMEPTAEPMDMMVY